MNIDSKSIDLQLPEDVYEAAKGDPRSEKEVARDMARDFLFFPPNGRSSDFRNINKYIDTGLDEVEEAIAKSKPSGELTNRGNLTLGNIKAKFENARKVMNHEWKENTSPLAWVLQYGAEQSLKQEVGYLKAIRAPKEDLQKAKNNLNTNLEKLTEDLQKSGVKIETPKV